VRRASRNTAFRASADEGPDPMPSDTQALRARLAAETARRRTFAIISHPDAGKTTLTEKLLLYSGMIRTAGMVAARKGRKAATSDWMGLEQERGISITASAMQFPYKGVVINILDTPGHQDFSEDTYRTLTAADSVIMVIDAAKGVETQTRKLFEACRLRGIPVMTLVNKMDLPGRDPIDLMAEVEEVLGIQASALDWPVGSGREFRGVVDRRSREILLYEKTGPRGAAKASVTRLPLDAVEGNGEEGTGPLQPGELARVREELELLDEAGNPFSVEAFREGKVTPVFFGSALTNFGIEPLFDAFLEYAPAPQSRRAELDGETLEVEPTDEVMSAYVFKVQANMDPRHRDCLAFLRINSGRFEKDMTVRHHRLGKRVRLSRPHSLLVAERGTIEEAFPGDIIGVINPGVFAIGDTISGGGRGDFAFERMPQFHPEHFARVRPRDVGKRKGLDKGLAQLSAEGAIQILRDYHDAGAPPFLAAVGRLQFEVLQYRIEDEYGTRTDLEILPFSCSAWLRGDVDTFRAPTQAKVVRDAEDRAMVLFTSTWEKNYAREQNPDHELVDFG